MVHPAHLTHRLADAPLIFIDWSGVVSNDIEMVYQANNCCLEELGESPLTRNEWQPKTMRSAREFCETHYPQLDATAFENAFPRHLGKLKEKGVRPTQYSDAGRFFRWCRSRDKELIVISTHPTTHLYDEAVAYCLVDLAEYFGGLLYKSTVMLQILREKGIEPGSVPYLGDTEYDVDESRKAGVIAVAVTTGLHDRERLAAKAPDYLVHSLTNFMRLCIADA